MIQHRFRLHQTKKIFILPSILLKVKDTISDVKLAGETIPVRVQQLVEIEGDTFSREKVTQSVKRCDGLVMDGYAFSNVNPVPEINKEDHTAAFTFFVQPWQARLCTPD